MTAEINTDALTALRKPFPAALVGKLPRVTCPDCSDKRKTCSEHSKAKCNVCQAWVSTKHIHIDYVGHADVTASLLDADPAWNWEPTGLDANGLPQLDIDERGNPVGLWIRLTVGGVTRLGYGSVPAGQPDAVKVLIGDALRNAAMRFGVALDLWAKGDRADPTKENAIASGGQANRGKPRQAADDSWRDQPPVNRQQPAANGNGNGHAAALPAPEPEQPDAVTIAAWGARIDEITCQEDADKADAELKEIFTAGKISPATANAIRAAIKAKAAGLGSREESRQPTAEVLAWAQRIEDATDIAALRAVNEEAKTARKLSASYMREGKPVTLSQRIGARRAEVEARMAGAAA